MSDFIVNGPDGKPRFIGTEDPNNTPTPKTRDSAKIECPQCHNMVDYLLGQNAGGGKQGCEVDWKPPTEKITEGGLDYDRSQEILP